MRADEAIPRTQAMLPLCLSDKETQQKSFLRKASGHLEIRNHDEERESRPVIHTRRNLDRVYDASDLDA